MGQTKYGIDYRNREHAIRIGPLGGKYIISKGKKIYLPIRATPTNLGLKKPRKMR